MPLKSKAQHRKFQEMVKEGKLAQAMLDEWEAATPDIASLPERVEKAPKWEKKRAGGRQRRGR